MAVNPALLFQLKERLSIFQTQHPKVPMFLRDVGSKAIAPGTILELRVTDPNGRNYVTNIRLTPEDIETLETFKSMRY